MDANSYGLIGTKGELLELVGPMDEVVMEELCKGVNSGWSDMGLQMRFIDKSHITLIPLCEKGFGTRRTLILVRSRSQTMVVLYWGFTYGRARAVSQLCSLRIKTEKVIIPCTLR